MIYRSGVFRILLLSALLWGINILWFSRDTRPPVWDMALHQAYAIGYMNPSTVPPGTALWERSGNYPPFVHLLIAFVFLVLHPGPHVAALANVPATFILLWAVYELARILAGDLAATWACILTVLTPYLIWMSRETVLDYWLSALFAAALVVLLKTRGFQSHRWSLLFGFLLALGLLTKWLFAGLVFFPILYVALRNRIWRNPEQGINFADMLIAGGAIAGIWYLPNLPRLSRFFWQNAAFGAREGEPPVFSFQSLIYYARLLEGYQLFALLFTIVCLGCFFVLRKRLGGEWRFLALSIAGGWLVMTLLRTKDPRFTMPLIGPLLIFPGTWIRSWKKTGLNKAIQVVLVALLCVQAYAANFGISKIPKRIVLVPGYQGSFRWDWNLYIQDYFNTLGKPRREDWKQGEILKELAIDSQKRNAEASLALIPDLPFFNESNFRLYAAIRGTRIRIAHLQSAERGFASFDGFNYVLMVEGEQGMAWTTGGSKALNKIVVDSPQIFRLVGLYNLPTGDSVRLYFIQR